LMLETLIDSLEPTAHDETHIELALSGEMGTSLFRYPASYRQIMRRVRDQTRLKHLKLGISLNHGGIAGENNPTGAENLKLSEEGRAQMQSLIDECDFIGMSFYRPVRLPPSVDDFVRGIDHFMGEFQSHGLSVPNTTPMHFSEVGIGGGHNQAPTADSALAVQTPWAGTANPRDNPWRHPPMQHLRRQYHAALLEFLATQPARWHVSAAFLWSMGSWDPQNIQHRDFADAEIIDAIGRHNAFAETP
jgi:hypothetical protein